MRVCMCCDSLNWRCFDSNPSVSKSRENVCNTSLCLPLGIAIKVKHRTKQNWTSFNSVLCGYILCDAYFYFIVARLATTAHSIELLCPMCLPHCLHTQMIWNENHLMSYTACRIKLMCFYGRTWRHFFVWLWKLKKKTKKSKMENFHEEEVLKDMKLSNMVE